MSYMAFLMSKLIACESSIMLCEKSSVVPRTCYISMLLSISSFAAK